MSDRNTDVRGRSDGAPRASSGIAEQSESSAGGWQRRGDDGKEHRVTVAHRGRKDVPDLTSGGVRLRQ